MAKYTGATLKKCRSYGINPAVLGMDKKSKKEPIKKPRKLSAYARQLKEKQKVKFIYGILENQCHGYYEAAKKSKNVTSEEMLSLLERRLDNVVFRLGLAGTRAAAKQIVNHGHICVNGKRLNIPSYQVKIGDVITIKDNKKELEMFKELKGMKVLTPAWLEMDTNKLEGKIARLPKREDIDYEVEEHLIIELYSK